MKKLGTRTGHLVAFVLASAFGFVLLEAGVRLLVPQVTPYAGRGLYAPDDDLGHVLGPHVSAGDVRTNSLGFRDVERSPLPPPGVVRVLGLGDSFTFGGGWPREIYLRGLEERLRGAEVINAGVPAYSTHQEVGLLRKVGLALHPHWVVLGLFVTGDVIENHADEHLQVVDGELSRTPVGRWERLCLRSHAYRLLRRLFTAHADDRLLTPPFLAVERDRLRACARALRPDVRHGYDETERLLRDLAALASAHGFRVLVLLIPDVVQVDEGLRRGVLAASSAGEADFDFDRPQRQLTEALDRLELPVVDVLPEMRRRSRLGETLYLPGDTHWNEAGHALAADALAAALVAREPRLRRTDPIGP